MRLPAVLVTFLCVHAVPAQKCNGITVQVRIRTLCELRHNVHNGGSLLVSSLSRCVA